MGKCKITKTLKIYMFNHFFLAVIGKKLQFFPLYFKHMEIFKGLKIQTIIRSYTFRKIPTNLNIKKFYKDEGYLIFE